ncbi:MAG: hypothetical protein DMG79_06860 [Acidobacteria bacterium]|nr:MAG: hypothetical protein DMG79_06860 [Acidobacteriota bacterium]
MVAGSIPVSRSRVEPFSGSLSPLAKSRQAAIKVEKAQEFARLRAAVEQAFLPEKAERFLKQLDRKGIRVRDFDAVLAQRLLEGVVGEAELDAHKLYESLTLSDQAQMREFYLSKLEGVDVALRHKFKKLYQYY